MKYSLFKEKQCYNLIPQNDLSHQVIKSSKRNLVMYTNPPTIEQLEFVLDREFPRDTNTWAVATDEVRDLSRGARLMLGLGMEHALDFGSLQTPSQWNTQGIGSILRFYAMMDESTRCKFIQNHSYWFDDWLED